MQLRQYMIMNKITYLELSRLSGVNHGALCQIANGKMGVGRKRAKMIKNATNGAVTIRDLIQLDEE